MVGLVSDYGKSGMRTLIGMASFSLLMSSSFQPAFAEDQKPGQIQPYPYSNNPSYRRHQLRFEFPNDGIARAEFRSEHFYAIILKSAKACTITEQERLDVQMLFPWNKVFTDRFNCQDDPEEVITYTNVNSDYAFIAVYAGKSLDQAKALLMRLNLPKEFPGANIRRMQAVLVYS